MTEMKMLIIEDELIVAENIAAILEQEGYSIAGIADRSTTALALFKETKPHLIICDIHIKGKLNGIETAKAITAIEPVPFLYLTAYADEATLSQAAATDFEAYLLKPFVPAQLTVAVKLALERFYTKHTPKLKLTLPGKRELEILELVASGKSSGEIAEQLFLSIHTVNTHRKNLMNKYDAQSSAELIALAIKQGWIS
jgi:DNA-binding NarL/FixJ family response regulator